MSKVSQAAVAPQKKNSNFALYMKRNWQLYVLMILPMLFVLVFKFGAYKGFIIAFQDYKVAKGYRGSEFVLPQGFRQICMEYAAS